MEKKLIALQELAFQLNFYVSTISRALNDHQRTGLRTKTKIQKSARQPSYLPNKNVLFFREQKTYLIGVIIPNLDDAFFAASLNAIETLSQSNNYHILIGQSHDNYEQERQIVFSMKKQHVDGLIISLSKHTTNYNHLTALINGNIPVVFFDRVPDSDDLYKVSANVLHNTEISINYLLQNGHKRIAVINGPEEMETSKEIVKKYYEVLKNNNIKIDSSLIFHTLLTKESTFKAMEELLKLKIPPGAILVFNDYMAIDAIEYARKENFRINQGICFVSYTNIPITKYLEFPPQASVEQYPYEQAKKATELLLKIMNSEKDALNEKIKFQHILVKGDLIIHKK